MENFDDEDEQIEAEFKAAANDSVDTDNEDINLINNSMFLIKDILSLDSDLYDQLNEDKIKAVRQTFDVITTINKKIINDYKKK